MREMPKASRAIEHVRQAVLALHAACELSQLPLPPAQLLLMGVYRLLQPYHKNIQQGNSGDCQQQTRHAATTWAGERLNKSRTPTHEPAHLDWLMPPQTLQLPSPSHAGDELSPLRRQCLIL